MAEQKRIERLRLDRIVADPDVFGRVEKDIERVTLFAFQLREDKGLDLLGPNGQDLPVVFADGKVLWLGDGFLRHDAYLLADRTEWWCEVRTGGKREALLFAAGTDLTCPAPKTRDDRKMNAEKLLRHEYWGEKLSFREIGRICGFGSDNGKSVAKLNQLIKQGCVNTHMSDNQTTDDPRVRLWPDRFSRSLTRFRNLLLSPEADLVGSLPKPETPLEVAERKALIAYRDAAAAVQREKEESEAVA